MSQAVLLLFVLGSFVWSNISAEPFRFGGGFRPRPHRYGGGFRPRLPGFGFLFGPRPLRPRPYSRCPKYPPVEVSKIAGNQQEGQILNPKCFICVTHAKTSLRPQVNGPWSFQ